MVAGFGQNIAFANYWPRVSSMTSNVQLTKYTFSTSIGPPRYTITTFFMKFLSSNTCAFLMSTNIARMSRPAFSSGSPKK